jgi:uncharacterized protein
MTGGQNYDGFLPGQYPIDGYGAGGFRFADMSHRGSLLALPSGVRAWSVTRVEDITIESLQSVLDEPAGSIQHLIIGTGLTLVHGGAALVRKLKQSHGITIEYMDSAAAARTYNILLGEKRLVAAALMAVI